MPGLRSLTAALFCLPFFATSSALHAQAATGAPQPVFHRIALAAAPQAGLRRTLLPSTPARPDLLLDGTAVRLRLLETVSSGDARSGQQVRFEVARDVSAGDRVVIAEGTAVLATIAVAEPKRRLGRGGRLEIHIVSTRALSKQTIPLRAIRGGGGYMGRVTAGNAATGLALPPVAPRFLPIRGKDIVIPEGTEITAFVEGDMEVRLAPPPTRVQASLIIQSNQPGADIEIDGAFAGNTPSTLTVTPGDHTIAVKKKGFTDWTRSMSVSATAINLTATQTPAL